MNERPIAVGNGRVVNLYSDGTIVEFYSLGFEDDSSRVLHHLGQPMPPRIQAAVTTYIGRANLQGLLPMTGLPGLLGVEATEERGLVRSLDGVGRQRPNAFLNPGTSIGLGAGEVLQAGLTTVAAGAGLATEVITPIIAYISTLSDVRTRYSVLGRVAGFTARLSAFVYNNRSHISNPETSNRFEFGASHRGGPAHFRVAAVAMANSTAVRYRSFGASMGQALIKSVGTGTAYEHRLTVRQFFYDEASDESLRRILRALHGGRRFEMRSGGQTVTPAQAAPLREFINDLYSQYGLPGRPEIPIFDGLWRALMGQQDTPASVARQARAEAGVTAETGFVTQMALAVAPQVAVRALRGSAILARRTAQGVASTWEQFSTNRAFFNSTIDEIFAGSGPRTFVARFPGGRRTLAAQMESLKNTLWRQLRASSLTRRQFEQVLRKTTTALDEFPKLVRSPDNFAELFKLYLVSDFPAGVSQRVLNAANAELRAFQFLSSLPDVRAISLVRQTGIRRTPDLIVRTQVDNIVSWVRAEVTSITNVSRNRHTVGVLRSSIARKANHGQLSVPAPGFVFSRQGGYIYVRLERSLTNIPNGSTLQQVVNRIYLQHQNNQYVHGIKVFIGNQLVASAP